MKTFVLIDGEFTTRAAAPAYRSSEVAAAIDGDRVRIPPEQIADALGWHLRDEGLCRGDACVPLGRRDRLVSHGGIDLTGLAEALDRPLALDAGERVAVLGTSAGARASELESLKAPDFELPDLGGRMHRLSDHRGKKVLLIAHASW